MSGLFPPPADMPAMWEFEHQAVSSGYTLVAGTDEVGRGPLAGPVVAAAVIWPREMIGRSLAGVTDSKKVAEADRPVVADRIRRLAMAVAVGAAGPGEIDRINILSASLLAMRRAVEALNVSPDFVLVDGNKTIVDLDLDQRAVVKGDGRSYSVAAASIVAKVARDRMMAVLDRVFPGYGFAGHKGYATREHYRALAELGPCAAHRRSFRGVLPEGEG